MSSEIEKIIFIATSTALIAILLFFYFAIFNAFKAKQVAHNNNLTFLKAENESNILHAQLYHKKLDCKIKIANSNNLLPNHHLDPDPFPNKQVRHQLANRLLFPL